MKTLIFMTALAQPLCAQADALLPAFDAGNFTAPRPNPYFPMEQGQVATLTGTIQTGGGAEPFSLIRTINGPGPILLGVQTVAILDDEYEGGLLTESSLDYFATDNAGAVWYFGEDVTAYEYDDAGTLVSKGQAPSWTAGVDGAEPGIVIEVEPVLAKPMFRAHAPKADETEFSVVESLGEQVVVYTESTTDAELRDRSTYARGIGLIKIEEDLSADKTDPVISAVLAP